MKEGKGGGGGGGEERGEEGEGEGGGGGGGGEGGGVVSFYINKLTINCLSENIRLQSEQMLSLFGVYIVWIKKNKK